jgi:hypothetical protein
MAAWPLDASGIRFNSRANIDLILIVEGNAVCAFFLFLHAVLNEELSGGGRATIT